MQRERFNIKKKLRQYIKWRVSYKISLRLSVLTRVYFLFLTFILKWEWQKYPRFQMHDSAWTNTIIIIKNSNENNIMVRIYCKYGNLKIQYNPFNTDSKMQSVLNTQCVLNNIMNRPIPFSIINVNDAVKVIHLYQCHLKRHWYWYAFLIQNVHQRFHTTYIIMSMLPIISINKFTTAPKCNFLSDFDLHLFAFFRLHQSLLESKLACSSKVEWIHIR